MERKLDKKRRNQVNSEMFKNLSDNTFIIIDEILKNENLCKLIYYNEVNPIEQDEIENKDKLIYENLIPIPYNPEVQQEEKIELRLFFGDADIENRFLLDAVFVCQVVCPFDLWRINVKDEEGIYKPRVRPYEIMHEVTETFRDKTIGKLGVIQFENCGYRFVADKYGFYELMGSVLSI